METGAVARVTVPTMDGGDTASLPGARWTRRNGGWRS